MYTAKEAKAEGLRIAFTDAIMGADTGWWGDLIYTRDVYRMADRSRKAIAEALDGYLETVGEPLRRNRANQTPGAETILTACILAPPFAEWVKPRPLADDGFAPGDWNMHERRADALMFGLKFAVEWYAQELASEMGVEL
jgi:hypothetical protein